MRHASAQATATETARAYRHSVAQLAAMDVMDRYYLSIEAEKVLDRLRADGTDSRSLELPIAWRGRHRKTPPPVR